jgi:hypothetical protein
MFEKHKFYDQVKKSSYEGVIRFLSSRKPEADPSSSNAAAVMMSCVATNSDFLSILELSMPVSLRKVRKDILALDALAFVVCSMSQAIKTRRRTDSMDGLESIWLPMTTTPRDTKEHYVEIIFPDYGGIWLDRWKEFREIVSFQERFNLLMYVL